jgi:hypothetical protein
VYDLGEISAGYARTLRAAGGMVLSAGARGTVNVVPPALREAYGSRLPLGAAVFLSLRPGGAAPHQAHGME